MLKRLNIIRGIGKQEIPSPIPETGSWCHRPRLNWQTMSLTNPLIVFNLVQESAPLFFPNDNNPLLITVGDFL